MGCLLNSLNWPMLFYRRGLQWRIYIVKFWTSPGVQILLISCSFWEILAKSYVDAPWRVGTPTSWKSWIRHWVVDLLSWNHSTNSFKISVMVPLYILLFNFPWMINKSSGVSRIFLRRGRQLPRGAPTYDFAKISQKLHEFERIWTRGGGVRPLRPP